MRKHEHLVCEFCFAEKKDNTFVIGAKRLEDKKNWCMVEGTGKMSCPDCYEKALNDAKKTKERFKNLF